MEMSFVKSKGFKYVKNLIIGVGVVFVLVGVFFKIESWLYVFEMLIFGMGIEVFIFVFFGIIGLDFDYYWYKLYLGLDDYNMLIQFLIVGGGIIDNIFVLNGEVVEQQLGGMLIEFQGMFCSLGSFKVLQEVDFLGVFDQVKLMINFYGKLNEVMVDLVDLVEDIK